MSHIEALRNGIGSGVVVERLDSELLPPWDPRRPAPEDGPARVEAAAKVTGAARYSGDVRLPGMLYAGVLRSPVACGLIVHLDTARAEAVPGVHAVLCHHNAPDIRWHDCALFDRQLRFVGDEVAAVAAETPAAVADALAALDVRYEPQPHVLDIAAAEADGAAPVHATGNQAGEPKRYQRGDVDAALAQADVVIDEIYATQTALHNSLEPHGCTAAWENGQLTLWESTQGVYQIRKEVAQHLGLPQGSVRVVCEYMGGGFGAKLVMWKHSLIAALLARSAQRPVQLMLDREAENLAAGNRNSTRVHVRLGAKRDGTLTAIDVESVAAIGANAVGGESSNVTGMFQRLYRCANVRTRQRATYTHSGPSCAFRAPGYVEGAFALECAMDVLSRRLELDPLELRLLNYADRDQVRDLPYSAPDGLRQCYERLRETFRSPGAAHLRAESSRIRRGIGMAAHEWGGSGNPPAAVWAKLNHDGSLEVLTGSQDIGTGTRTALCQIAAEELGIDLGRVSVRLGDTAAGPFAPMSGGSATLATVGPAVRAAVADLGARLVAAAAAVHDQDPRRLRRGDGEIVHVDGTAGPWPLDELAADLEPHMVVGEGVRGANPPDRSVRTFGAQVVEVAVDVQTGEVRVERVVAAHDCGRVINPRLLDGQIMGGVIQGLGFALLEERVTDADSGVPLTINLEEYHVPTLADAPVIERAGASSPDLEANAVAVKGIGEPPMIPVAPAIVNAVYDAVGVRINETPITRARLLGALARAGALSETVGAP